jgi:hypothetical protein
MQMEQDLPCFKVTTKEIPTCSVRRLGQRIALWALMIPWVLLVGAADFDE